MPMPYAKASCDAQKILCILYLKLFPPPQVQASFFTLILSLLPKNII